MIETIHLKLLLATFAGWITRQQSQVIAYDLDLIFGNYELYRSRRWTVPVEAKVSSRIMVALEVFVKDVSEMPVVEDDYYRGRDISKEM